VINQDFKEFFASLNDQSVEFLIIGGVAYNHYAPPRATKDIDVWVRPTKSNLEALRKAVEAFGFPITELRVDELLEGQRVLMLGRAPYRIDILTQPDGVEWNEAWEERVPGDYGGVPLSFLGLRQLIQAKLATGRPRDLADVATLKAVRHDD